MAFTPTTIGPSTAMQAVAPPEPVRLHVRGPEGADSPFNPATTAVNVIVPPKVGVPLDESEIVGDTLAEVHCAVSVRLRSELS